MTTLTLSVPQELKRKMELFAEINWSAVAREAFKQKIADLEFLRKFKAQSAISEKDALQIGKKVTEACKINACCCRC